MPVKRRGGLQCFHVNAVSEGIALIRCSSLDRVPIRIRDFDAFDANRIADLQAVVSGNALQTFVIEKRAEKLEKISFRPINIPIADHAILGPRQDTALICTELRPADGLVMVDCAANWLPGRCVPQADSAGARSQPWIIS